jgi:glycine/D-amino acid oxidase-like deaminating enzyme
MADTGSDQGQGCSPPVVIVGAGLCGSLAALALARRGVAVTLIDAAAADATPGDAMAGPVADGSATALSYGGVLGRKARRDWRRLERLHGPLGWRSSRLVPHHRAGLLAVLPPPLLAAIAAVVPYSRVDAVALASALPGALRRAGVHCRKARVLRLERRGDGDAGAHPDNGAGRCGGWRLVLAGMDPLGAKQVVLAAGAGSRALWPFLPCRFRLSWAGVLVVERNPGGNAWLEQVRRGHVVLPADWQRPRLEARAPSLERDDWIVDPGLAPWGEQGVLLGQISLVPSTAADAEAETLGPPDPAVMEARLRCGLAHLDPGLARLEGLYRQVPVSFCTDGQALLGPAEAAGPEPQTRRLGGTADAEGLWVCAGFSGAFSLVPAAVERLADAMLRGRSGTGSGVASPRPAS